MASSTHIADPKGVVEKGYDQIASQYLAWSSPRPTTTRAAYIEKLIALLPPGAKVLELGCGAGVPSTQTLIKAGLAVTGVDISASQLALAKEHIPQATLVHGDMMSLTFEPESFDAVVAFYSIFHLPRDEQGMMVGKIKTWLKKGGWMLLNLNGNEKEGDTVQEDWMGVTMFSSRLGVDGNRDILKNNRDGLKVVEDEVAIEKVGPFDEKFHWIMAVKQSVDNA
ncbi:S-adenosyl-L-methionine-dependent methyltransferase [Hymenopellis radicata]|nr:S-adenosyl-L-methionine-dependent methyltransferase [Hymenopellis radicata]